MTHTPEKTKILLMRRIACAASVCAFLILLLLVVTNSAAGFDDPVREWFYGLRREPLTRIIVPLTNLADHILIIILCLLLLILPQTRIRYGVPLSAGALGLTILNSVIKHLVCRPRPEVLHLVEESGFSFSSGHSVTSMFFYGLAICLVWRYFENRKAACFCAALLAVPMLLIGPSRIYLGVHYPTDVLAGWCLGITGIILTLEILDHFSPKAGPGSPGDSGSSGSQERQSF